ncbi:RNA polymerase sigma factor [Tunicatimonas pelagia]|uniref:RNA polymerase sigma factor n=1 Tax=Tunicatimonas pelagia TaxID=931531 RepID=UPI002666B4D3|nr:RNA polymerase sigma factor [Tunicatimonas pelagia]WKN44843.1 RNA polymerase sigma factor [Tunicatimonas pelagia]
MKKYPVSDSQLVCLFKEGSESAFEQLVHRHKSRLYTTIYLVTKDAYIAEDILQNTFIKVVNTIKSERYNEEGKFLPWVMRIAHNLAIDNFRKGKRYPTIIMKDGHHVFNTLNFSEDSAESVQIKKDTHALLRQLIKELPDEQRQVLTTRHYMNMSFKEIAEATGVSINTSLGCMRYALMNLRKKMEKHNIMYNPNRYPL